MKRILEIIRILLVSPEALLLVVIAGLFIWKNLWLVYIGKSLLEHDDVTTWMPILPISLCGGAIFLAFKLTEPKDGSNKALYDWPEYWRLEYRRNIGIGWCSVSVLTVLIAWIFRDELSLAWVGGLFVAAIGLAVISSSTLLLATFVLKRLSAGLS
ncbi:MAG: hypothetical protein GXY61_00090 [Lentisphaerae bacterium]|jgi:hypothetical protein|nr:hypothetical protein [Lentisphaerota bacterium]